MLDEPLGSLDRPRREHLVVELRDLFARLRQSVLFVTHDHEEAFAVADRVAVVRDGRVEQVGPAPEVWSRPATAFVARFLGYTVTSAFSDRPAAVRPDGLGLCTGSEAAGSSPVGVPAVVATRTFRRDHFTVRVEAADGPLEVAVRDQPVPAVGDRVRVVARPGCLVPLPSTDGDRDRAGAGPD
jgi:thiamine transport system ATP-binding protein